MEHAGYIWNEAKLLFYLVNKAKHPDKSTSNLKKLLSNLEDFLNTFSIFRYETDTHNHAERAFLRNGEKVVIGAFGVKDPTTGYVQMTMYTADKDGYRPVVRFGIERNLLKSAVGK